MVLQQSWPTEDPEPGGNPVAATRQIFEALVPGVGVLKADSPLVSGVSGQMAYQVNRFVAATPRNAEGIELVANDAPMNVPTTVAPTSGSRTDIIWVKANLPSLGDTQVLPEMGVSQTLPAGAIELGRAVVPAGATDTTTSAPTSTPASAWAKPAPAPVIQTAHVVAGTTVAVGANVTVITLPTISVPQDGFLDATGSIWAWTANTPAGDNAGYLQLFDGGTKLAERRWHTHGHNAAGWYPLLEVTAHGIPITAGTHQFILKALNDPGSASDYQALEADLSISVRM